MPNNRKPKLAPGSRWEGSEIVDSTDCRISCIDSTGTQQGKILHTSPKDEPDCWVTDALAVIRAAKLDPVWDAAVRFSQLRDLFVFCPSGHNQLALLDQGEKLCVAVEQASQKGPSDD